MLGKELNLIGKLHNSTKRNYLYRMNDNKVFCMNVAKKYGKDYWDGKRRFGYGGYKYIPGRWELVAKKLIRKYDLNNSSRLLDVGCGKAFCLRSKKNLPKIKILVLTSLLWIMKSKKEIEKLIY